MSLSIENLSFTIWGSGHDATLLDSGDGEVQIFSHPFVPLNSINYAGQYYFLAPDEDGVMFDVVKDDVAHCTFSPALGTSFDTEGEVTVTVNYHREYIHDEETIIVDKTVKQTIEVVDHGTVVNSYTVNDVYSDGYCFIRPQNQTVYEETYWTTYGKGTKCSSIPWRTAGVGQLFANNNALVDISELAYADMSNLQSLNSTFKGCTALMDLKPLASWDVSNVVYTQSVFEGCTALVTLEGLENWNMSKCTDMGKFFKSVGNSITPLDIKALEKWNVSKVTSVVEMFSDSHISDFSPLAKWNFEKLYSANNMFLSCWELTNLAFMANWNTPSLAQMQGMFKSCDKLTSLNGAQGLNTSQVTNMTEVFRDCSKLSNISGIATWNTGKVVTFLRMFYNCLSLNSLTALANWNTSKATSMDGMFCINPNAISNPKVPMLHSLHGLENWDVSKVQNFASMFSHMWFLSDISAVSGWNVSSGKSFAFMFSECCGIESIDELASWNMSSATNLLHMFANIIMYHALGVDVDFIKSGADYNYYDIDGNEVILPAIVDLSTYPVDCDGASGWVVNIPSPTDCFYPNAGNYINVPAWN